MNKMIYILAVFVAAQSIAHADYQVGQTKLYIDGSRKTIVSYDPSTYRFHGEWRDKDGKLLTRFSATNEQAARLDQRIEACEHTLALEMLQSDDRCYPGVVEDVQVGAETYRGCRIACTRLYFFRPGQRRENIYYEYTFAKGIGLVEIVSPASEGSPSYKPWGIVDFKP